MRDGISHLRQQQCLHGHPFQRNFRIWGPSSFKLLLSEADVAVAPDLGLVSTAMIMCTSDLLRTCSVSAKPLESIKGFLRQRGVNTDASSDHLELTINEHRG